MEIWDAYKKDGSLAGCELIRGEPIPKGLFHMVCEVLVQHLDGSYLLMQRDINTSVFPGMFEATAGGSALKGDNPIRGAMRELYEETGILAKSLLPIYRIQSRDTIYNGFLCVTDCDKSSVVLQLGETIDYKWLSKDDFLKFIDSEKYVPTHRERLKPYLEQIK